MTRLQPEAKRERRTSRGVPDWETQLAAVLQQPRERDLLFLHHLQLRSPRPLQLPSLRHLQLPSLRHLQLPGLRHLLLQPLRRLLLMVRERRRLLG